MDLSETELCKLNNTIDEIVESFDSLFHDIIGAISISQSSTSLQLHHAVIRNSLSDVQCEHIKQLGGLINTAKSILNAYNIRKHPDFEKLVSIRADDSVSTLEEKANSDFNTIKKLSKTCNLLQDYLRKELNRTEELEIQLKEKETEIVLNNEELIRVQREKDKYFKQLHKYDAVKDGNPISNDTATEIFYNNSHSNNVNSSSKNIKQEDEVIILEKTFIRKNFGGEYFFGLVVEYDEPYYRVIIYM